MVQGVKCDIPKEELERLYWVEDLTLKELANYFNCGVSSINNYLNKYNINKKGIGAKNKYQKFDYNSLYEMYITNNMSKSEIAKDCNVSVSFVTRELHRLKIKKKGGVKSKYSVDTAKVQEHYKNGCKRVDIAKHYGVNYDTVALQIAKGQDWEVNTTDVTYEILFNLFVNKNMNVNEISDFINVDTNTIFKHLEKYDLI